MRFACLSVRSRRYRQVSEVSAGAQIDPERHGAPSIGPRLEAVDDERRLRMIVHVETALATSHFDSDLGPLVRESTYDSYFSGVSLRSRNHVHAGCEMYWTERFRRT